MKKKIEKLQVNFSVFIRLVSIILVMVLVTPVITSAQTGKVNFSGTWTLNTEKSTQPQGGPGGGRGMRMGGNFVATQEGNELTVVRSRTDQSGQPVTTTLKYTLDGKESINTTPRGESKSIAKWSSDGKSLTIETSRTMDMNGDTRTMKSTEVWMLTDAKTLSVTTTRQGMNGEVKNNMVYDKK
jgi:Tol biopolymer transport system component